MLLNCTLLKHFQEQDTPLTTACQLGYTDAVLALIKAKADVNMPAKVPFTCYTEDIW